MNEETRLKAREFLLRSKIYRFLALVFAILGLLVFAGLYFKNFNGDLLEAVTSVWVVAILLLPFFPACVLSWMAVRAEKKLSKILEQRNLEKD